MIVTETFQPDVIYSGEGVFLFLFGDEGAWRFVAKGAIAGVAWGKWSFSHAVILYLSMGWLETLVRVYAT